MNNTRTLLAIFALLALASSLASAAAPPGNFSLNGSSFLLNGQPFQIISGEMHFARIVPEYWRHRVQMAKAMGLNTIAAYVFWNFHESSEGVFDFESPSHNIRKFIQIIAEEGMYMLLRPGPYTCAEWDFGGLPSFLLRKSGLKVRTNDPHYMFYAERYVKRLLDEVREFQITRGGPILMVQIENEYGSFGNDKLYVENLKSVWSKHGIEVPFYTADGGWREALVAGNVKGAALGLDPGISDDSYKVATQVDPNVPSFSSETYPGWLTHWGESWAGKSTKDIANEVKYILDHNKSFNLYVVHGGTNFAFWAGANDGGPGGYQAHVTSYDYDAPIGEQGRVGEKFFTLRDLINSYTKRQPIAPPQDIPAITIPQIALTPYSSLWDNVPEVPIRLATPSTFENLNQHSGFILYKNKVVAQRGGDLSVQELRDFATVYFNDQYVGNLDRSAGKHSIKLPTAQTSGFLEDGPVLEIMVEAMGRINFGQYLMDAKGITEKVFINGMQIMEWDHYQLPLDDKFIRNLKQSTNFTRKGVFHKGSFNLTSLGDTFIDVSHWQKGIVWVNGHNLGRYWNIGPQTRLFCPAPFLKLGTNEVLLFDHFNTTGGVVSGEQTLKPVSGAMMQG